MRTTHIAQVCAQPVNVEVEAAVFREFLCPRWTGTTIYSTLSTNDHSTTIEAYGQRVA